MSEATPNEAIRRILDGTTWEEFCDGLKRPAP